MKHLLLLICTVLILTGCAANGKQLTKKLNIPIQTNSEKDGLYLKEDRYIYRGVNPNNYIKFNNQLLRIIAFEIDGTIKIKAPNINLNEEIAFDNDNKNDWKKTSLNKYLNDIYYNSLDEEDRELIIFHNWEIGKVTTDIYERVIVGEKELLKEAEIAKTYKGYIGLLTMSDYFDSLLSTTCLMNNASCTSTYIQGEGISWTINKNNNSTNWIINYATGFATVTGTNHTNFYIEPVFYLKKGLKIRGTGKLEDPFTIE